MDAQVPEYDRPRQRRRRVAMTAFECGCFQDWSGEPPGEREQRARGAVASLATSIVENQGAAP